MKVAVFGARKYDIDSLNATCEGTTGVELSFFEPLLDQTTALLSEGHEAVCIFVNDICDAVVLELLHQYGVRYVALRCAGFNNVDLAAAAKYDIKVTRVPSYAPEAVAEFAVGMILTVVRKYHKSFCRVREGNFLLDGLLGFNLAGKTVGIVGTGKIGLITGRILAKGFCCNVVAFDPYPSAMAGEYGITYVDTLEELLKQSDIISLHCPLTDQTKYIINDNTLALTKPGVILINTSRGGLIDSRALIRALKSGQLGAVGLDVYEREAAYFFADSSSKVIHDDVFARLLSFYNVFLSGHQAYLTTEALRNIADTTIRSLKDLEASGTSANLVE
ncbi:D-lactate dehydrogenase [Lyophyllum atratum]|nr:D-lactate dehydrogenase [Lyophyllum atratum]